MASNSSASARQKQTARLFPNPTEHYLYRQIPFQELDGSVVTFILVGSSVNTNDTYILIS